MGNPRFGKWDTDNSSPADHTNYNGFDGYGSRRTFDSGGVFKKHIDVLYDTPEKRREAQKQWEERRKKKEEEKQEELRRHIDCQKRHTHYYQCDQYAETLTKNPAEVTCRVCKAKIAKLNIHAGIGNSTLCNPALMTEPFFIRPAGHKEITCKTCLRIISRVSTRGVHTQIIHYKFGGCDGKQSVSPYSDEVTCPNCLKFIQLNKIGNKKDFPEVPILPAMKSPYGMYHFRCPVCGRKHISEVVGEQKSQCLCWKNGIVLEDKK